MRLMTFRHTGTPAHDLLMTGSQEEELEGRPDLIHLRADMVEWQLDMGNREKATEIYEKLVDNLDERAAELVPDRDRLHRVFAPDSLDYQAKRLRIRNPYQEESRKDFEDRDKDKDDDAEDDDIPV